jgi:hypothetical protein
MTKTIYVKVRLTLEGDIINRQNIVDIINDVDYDFRYDNGLVRITDSDYLEVIHD